MEDPGKTTRRSPAPPEEMAQAPRGHTHTAFLLITLEILEDTLKIFSMSEPCRSSLHFSSSSSLEAPQEEQVWLAVGIQCQERWSTSWWPPFPPPPVSPTSLPLGLSWFPGPGHSPTSTFPPLLLGPWNHLCAQLRWVFCQLLGQRQPTLKVPQLPSPLSLFLASSTTSLVSVRQPCPVGPLMCPQLVMLTQ